MRTLALVAVVFLGDVLPGGCGGGRPQPRDPATLPPMAVEPGSENAPVPIASSSSEWVPGTTVTVRGRVSKTPWQHMTTSVPGKVSAYFDLEGGKEQTVVYWKDAPTCGGEIEVVGKVLEVRGASKKPGERESKADESWRELQLDVTSARCL